MAQVFRNYPFKWATQMTNLHKVIDYCTGNQLLSVVTDPTNRLIDYCTRTLNRVISQNNQLLCVDTLWQLIIVL